MAAPRVHYANVVEVDHAGSRVWSVPGRGKMQETLNRNDDLNPATGCIGVAGPRARCDYIPGGTSGNEHLLSKDRVHR